MLYRKQDFRTTMFVVYIQGRYMHVVFVYICSRIATLSLRQAAGDYCRDESTLR
jgi:hypothetical protein